MTAAVHTLKIPHSQHTVEQNEDLAPVGRERYNRSQMSKGRLCYVDMFTEHIVVLGHYHAVVDDCLKEAGKR